MTDTADTPDLLRALMFTEAAVNAGLREHDREDLALAVFSAGAALLVPIWGAERTLAALDEVVEAAIKNEAERRSAH